MKKRLLRLGEQSSIQPFYNCSFFFFDICVENSLNFSDPGKDTTSGYEPGEDAAIKYCRLQKIMEGGEPAVTYGPKEAGTGSVDEEVVISFLIEVLNLTA